MNYESFPKLDLFPKLTELKRFVGHMLTGPHCLATHGNHFNHDNPFDTELYGPPTKPFDPGQLRMLLEFNGVSDGLDSRI